MIMKGCILMSNDFLKRMIEEGRKHSTKPSFRTTGQMTIKLGFSGKVKGHKMTSLFKVFDKPENSKYVSDEVTGHIKKLGGSTKAIICILIKVPDEMALNSDWGYERLISEVEEEDWDAVIQAIEELGLPILEPFWCTYELVDAPSSVAKGDKGKYPKKKDGVETGEMVYPRIAIPVTKFANEQAAREAVGGDSSDSSNANSDSAYSDMVREGIYPTVANFEEQFEHIQKYYNIMKGGKLPYEGAPTLPVPLIDPTIKSYLADMYTCEVEDIDLALQVPPF